MEILSFALDALRRRAVRLVPPRLHVLAALPFALAGCAPEVNTLSFVEPDTGRPYRVVSRPDHDAGRPAAVLVSLHAYSTAADVVVDGFSLVRHVVRDRRWLLVIPEGKPDAAGRLHWNATAACCGEGERKEDDLRYLRSVLSDVKQRFAVDPARVFAFGVSNGGFMAHRWASVADSELTGIIALSSAAPGPDDAPFAAPRPVSVVHVHGMEDAVIPYGGKDEPGRRQPSVPDSVALWVKHGGCAASGQRSRRRSLFFSAVDVETWSCPNARVSAWTFRSGAHNIRDARFFMAEYLDLITPG